MAGGVGSRFWPMSTAEHPKQFIDVMGCGRTMLQQTFDRYTGIVDIAKVWVVTSAQYKDMVQEQLPGISQHHILLEPCMRNTAPCVAYVSWKIQKEDPEALVVVAPSDHLVQDVAEFRSCISAGFEFVAGGDRILTLGMNPTRPETGYGYIEQGPILADEATGQTAHSIFTLQSFREKPDLKTAMDYLQRGGFTWNSGMFLWSVETITNEIRTHAPRIASVMDRILPQMFTPGEQAAVNELFPSCEKISIDYAVMEKTKIAYVMPAEFGWSDVGTWGSLHKLSGRDADDNAVIGDGVKMIECEGNMVRMPHGKKVVIQGLKNCIVTEHDGTLLICQLSEEQRIKDWHD